jgi:hypothetical protein
VSDRPAVGADGKLAFYPPNIAAAVGDTVTFVFNPKNHTVTQSSFDAPCQPLADTTHGQEIGFNSGLCVLTFVSELSLQLKIPISVPVAPGETYLPTFTIGVEDVRWCQFLNRIAV